MSNEWDPEADDPDYSDHEYDVDSNDDDDNQDTLGRLEAAAQADADLDADGHDDSDYEYDLDSVVAEHKTGAGALSPASTIVASLEDPSHPPRGTKRAHASDDDHVISKLSRIDGDGHALRVRMSWSEIVGEDDWELRSYLLNLKPCERWTHNSRAFNLT